MRPNWCLALFLLPEIAAANILDWRVSAQSMTKSALMDVAFSSTLSGLVLSRDGLIMRTTDGGTKWAGVFRGRSEWKRLGVRGQLVVAIGTGVVAVSTDGGMSFHESPVPHHVSLNGVDIDGTGGIWVCGMAGKIIFSANQGASWQDRSPGRPEALFSIRSLQNGIVLAGGRTGMWILNPSGRPGPRRDVSSGRPGPRRDVSSGSWVQSLIPKGTAVLDMDEDPNGVVWMLVRLRNKTGIWRCKDIMLGCDKIESEDERDLTRLRIGGDNVWLAGDGAILARAEKSNYTVLQQENMPKYSGNIMASCMGPDGTVWAVGENGAIFSGIHGGLPVKP